VDWLIGAFKQPRSQRARVNLPLRCICLVSLAARDRPVDKGHGFFQTTLGERTLSVVFPSALALDLNLGLGMSRPGLAIPFPFFPPLPANLV